MKSNHKKTIFLFLLLLVFVFTYIFYKEGTLPVNRASKDSTVFIVRPGEGLTTIINNLEKEKLIRNRIVFFIVVKKLGIEKKIQAGDFRLSQSMDAYDVAKNLTHGTLDIWVTIIEGLRKEEIAQIFSRELGIPEIEFIKHAEEGYLFPDTYLIPKQATAEAVVRILTNNFNSRFHPSFDEKRKRLGLTREQTVILASLVEREARLAGDRQPVASVLLKRMRSGIPLQVDATVQYALGYQPDEKTWWKKELSLADLKIDSLYNTYQNQGLPPEPICNPGLASIEAVVNADPQTPYLFYVSDKHGKLHFGRTGEDHERNIERYLR